ncbi:dihydrodipicolinate synthase family protein [Blastopirellula marina]|uniref:Dihydrodipicolinate synthase family protein n=1 Tax=Blastopirellula marina TaxID=124 RepID=A0A2S8G9N7_9BACT|nr:dihydrodipicolinate synthase family protein [Blastopirellula marina]PQO41176.1 dihydrodipicolinate synthase family protein [Blastopirellula marina]PTL46052.1 dihydrodipicolinate synthase family protein [Blastopirellula marina]
MKLQGIIPPLVTPLADRDALDETGLTRLIARQLAGRVDGLFVLGTTGEGPSLSEHLRRQMIAETARLVDDQVPIFVGITDTSLVDAIHLAQFALNHGAAAVVAAPPFYFPAGQTELQHWFLELAEALPLPLLLYNMPSCVNISIEPETLSILIQHPNIVGLKDSSGDLDYFAQAMQISQQKTDWPVLMGPEALLVEAMKLGAAGGVTGGANLWPELFTDLFAAAQASDQPTIERLQATVVELQALYGFGKYGSSYLKGLKCAMELSGICSGLLAAPFDVFKAPERARVAAWLQAFSAAQIDFACQMPEV